MADEEETQCEAFYTEMADLSPKCMGGFNKSVFYFADINITMGAILLAGLVYYKMKQDCEGGEE